jgi:hypothetical protein
VATAPRPEQRDAERAEHRYIWAKIRTNVPVIVVSYDDAKNTATVRLRRNPRDSRGHVFEAPLLRDMPVAWPRGGGIIQRGELEPGDLCILLVSDRELGPQLLGPNGQPVDGESYERMHELSDGFVVPIGLSVPGATIAPAAGRTLYGREDGTVGIRMSKTDLEVDAPAIKIGKNAILDAARKTDKTSIDTTQAVWQGQVTAVCTGAAALLGLTPPTPATDFGVITGGSTKVKIE